MRKITLLVIIYLILIAGGANAQNLIAVQNGGNPEFYTKLDSAILHAQNGDTIYLPGGIYSSPSVGGFIIDKELHIIGVGHHPDSTQATHVSLVLGSIILKNGSNQGSLMGIKLQGGGIQIPTANDTIKNFTIKRCYIESGLYLAAAESLIFIENIIKGGLNGGASCPGVSNCLFSNNIIDAVVGNNGCSFINGVFRNNLFLAQTYCNYGCSLPINSPNSLFENNIFISNAGSYSATMAANYSVFNNNLFAENWLPSACSCLGLNNIINQLPSSIFINQTGNVFSYSHDYHLQPSCPGKNAGTDGTDIGIYGGSFPWKEGSIPFNPHVQYKSIGSTTDNEGNLNVNIKVEAQDR